MGEGGGDVVCWAPRGFSKALAVARERERDRERERIHPPFSDGQGEGGKERETFLSSESFIQNQNTLLLARSARRKPAFFFGPNTQGGEKMRRVPQGGGGGVI